MKKNYFISGEWNITCDVCSKKIKANEAKQRWDGFIVCEKDYETRQPQDFVRARQDKISVPFTRPIPAFLSTNVDYICSVDDKTAVAGLAMPGCVIVGNI